MQRDALARAFRRLARWLDCTPAEVAGLTLLLVGGLALAGLLWWRGIPRPAPDTSPELAILTELPLTVHVAGAVAIPGVVTVDAGSRVGDALNAAGGPLDDAELDGLNLARVLIDGERVLVPSRSERRSEGLSEAPISAWRADGRLDLNLASATDFEELPGIGPVLAGRIVAWRDAHGPFTQPGELREVAGIGERTFQSLADLVTT